MEHLKFTTEDGFTYESVGEIARIKGDGVNVDILGDCVSYTFIESFDKHNQLEIIGKIQGILHKVNTFKCS